MTTDITQTIHIIIAAAGIGSRFQQTQSDHFKQSTPKQYELIGSLPVLAHSIQAFDDIQVAGALVAGITVVLHPEDRHWQQLAEIQSKHAISTVNGGTQRHDSVRNGIRSLQAQYPNWANDWVMVHDAARPCVTTAEINDLMAACIEQHKGGLLVKPMSDTIKTSMNGETVKKTIDRSQLYAALTPQMFKCGDLLKALTVFEADSITDESSAIEAQGQNPIMVTGKNTNIKITQYDDLMLAKTILEQQGRL